MSRDRFRHFILHIEDIAKFALIIVSPKLSLVIDPDELGADAHTAGFAANTAFQQVLHTQFASDLHDRLVAMLVLHYRSSRHHAEPFRVHSS